MFFCFVLLSFLFLFFLLRDGGEGGQGTVSGTIFNSQNGKVL